MARILIVGGGCRGLGLARGLIERDHAVRMSTRSPAGRRAIEEVGAECWIGSPERLGGLLGALEGVAIVCWLLARLDGNPDEARALHGPRLESLLVKTVDTGVRGFLYEASPGALPVELLRAGGRILAQNALHNAIRWGLLEVPLGDKRAWVAGALEAVEALLEEPLPTLS